MFIAAMMKEEHVIKLLLKSSVACFMELNHTAHRHAAFVSCDPTFCSRS